LGAILAGILLIIDTQMIVGGERSFQISMDDYVLGALVLYVDIIRLFLYILRAMGKKK
jgi:FtsH-binding integral membrane protein